MLVCGQCGQENPEGFRFCGACASPLAGPAPEREERKVVTALFCDLVGSTAQTERMDVEDVQAILSRYHDSVATEIERWGGTVEKFIGDAVVALFGVPAAHEDDPERAVRAALAVRDWVASQDEVHVRIAVNTGEALVRIGARAEQGDHLATGDVLNTAARLQSAAPVDGILVGEPTYRVTRRVIDYRESPAVEAKGKAEPVPAWIVEGARARYGSDLDDRPAHPLVGRERELGTLRDALSRCESERTAQLVTLVGIPGIGKSRLVAELFRAAAASSEVYYWRQGRSLPYGESQSFWALAEIIKAQAGILESDGADEARVKLDEMLEAAVSDAEDREWVRGHLLALVGLGAGAGSPTDDREQAFAAWRRLLEGLAEQRPLILVFEDLHWADDGLLDFVDHLADWATTSAILLIGTARPELLERRPAWGGGKRNAMTLSIAPLTEEETQALLSGLLDQVLMPAELRSAVGGLAAGNPLYAEEYVRMLQDRGLLTRVGRTWQLSRGHDLPLPDTIQNLVAARIDALPAAEKDLLRDCAVVGKVFWPSAAGAIGPGDGAQPANLHALERKEFIRRERRSTVARETQYAFLHAIVREVAYRQIPRGERARKHQAVAAWIEQLAPDRSADRVDMLAHHYRRALELTRAAGGDLQPLIPAVSAALIQASERAEALNSWTAARELATEALELIPDGDPVAPSLAIRVARAFYNLAEIDLDSAVRARELARAQGDLELAAEAESLRARMLWQIGSGVEGDAALEGAVQLIADRPTSAPKVSVIAYSARRACVNDEYELALQLVEEVLDAARELGREDYVSHLLNTRGLTRGWRGDARGIEDLEQAIDAADRAGAPVEKAVAHNNLAQVLWGYGRIEAGAEQLVAYRETARRYGLHSLEYWADMEDVYLAYLRGDYHDLITVAERNLSARAGEAYFEEIGQTAELALAYAAVGRVGEALPLSERAIQLVRASGEPYIMGFVLLARVHALWAAGRGDDSAAAADEILAEKRHYKSLFWMAHLPLLLHEQGRAQAAEVLVRDCFPSPWRDAAEAVVAGRLAEAAAIFERIGSRFVAAWATLLAAEQGDLPPEELAGAAAHFRRVGAAPFLHRIEALSRASA